MHIVRKAGDEQTFACICDARNRNPFAIQKCAMASAYREDFVQVRLIDRSTFHGAVDFHADRYAPYRQTMRKIHRSIDGIDDPSNSCMRESEIVTGFARSQFFTEKYMIGIFGKDGIANRLFVA